MHFLLFLLAVLAVGGCADRTLERVNIDVPTAVCNDGSPAAYYFEAATEPAQAHIWVFQQEGGGWCWDAKTCAGRAAATPALVSSKTWGRTYTAVDGGILSANGTQFAKANVVYLKYCTSDGYIGDTPASAATGGLAFRGRQVVAATISALKEKHGLGASAAPAVVIYSGCSAGGRGVMHNLNYVQEQVHSLAGPGATVIGLVDSGLYIDIPTLDPTKTALADQAKGIVAFNKAAVDPYCASLFPGEIYKCLLGQYAIGNHTLRAPTVVHAFQYDAYQLYVDLPVGFGFLNERELQQHPEWNAVVEDFRGRTRRVLAEIESPSIAVHSSACYHHCNTETAAFSKGFKANGVSLAKVVDEFTTAQLKPPPSVNIAEVENCTGFACGADCDITVSMA